MTVRVRVRSLLVAAALGFVPAAVNAQASSTAAAEALFQEGRKAFKAGNYAEACPKLEESQRLDPATGTLLALALCHEQQKKFASAWAAFTDVETRARREGRKDRETLAREHATALRPKLSTLVLEVQSAVAQLPDLQVFVDGNESGAGSWGVAVPVDGGEHVVEAKATGKKTWRKSITVKTESDAARVEIAALEDAEPAVATTSDGAERPATEDGAASATSAAATTQDDPGKGLRIAGLVTAGAGVIALGVGSGLAIGAKSKYDEAKGDCTGSSCPSDPYDKIDEARTQGNIATVLMIGGGVAAAAGVTMWFLAPRSREAASRAQGGVALRRLTIGPGSFVAEGSF